MGSIFMIVETFRRSNGQLSTRQPRNHGQPDQRPRTKSDPATRSAPGHL